MGLQSRALLGTALGVRVGDRDGVWGGVGLGVSSPKLCPHLPHLFLQHPTEVPTGSILLCKGKVSGGLQGSCQGLEQAWV